MGVAKAALEASRPLPRRRPGSVRDPGQRHQRRPGADAGGRRASPASRRCTRAFDDVAPLRSNITPEDVGRSALYLASDLSSAVTGEILYVDGGFNIMGVPTSD